MRCITSTGLSLIKRFEGFRAAPYLCPAGYYTIGYGHLVRKSETFSSITEEAASEMLRFDVEIAERAVFRLIARPLSDGQFDALVSFTFNLGAGALQASMLRRKVNSGYDAEVPHELRKWIWAGGKKLQGLVRRREAEVMRYRS